MKQAYLVLAAALVCTPAAAQENPLQREYPSTVGEYAAISLSEILKLYDAGEERLFVTYDPEHGTLDVEVMGTTSSSDRARSSLERLWDFIGSSHIEYARTRYDVELSEDHYRLIYYSRAGSEVLTFDGGRFLLP